MSESSLLWTRMKTSLNRLWYNTLQYCTARVFLCYSALKNLWHCTDQCNPLHLNRVTTQELCENARVYVHTLQKNTEQSWWPAVRTEAYSQLYPNTYTNRHTHTAEAELHMCVCLCVWESSSSCSGDVDVPEVLPQPAVVIWCRPCNTQADVSFIGSLCTTKQGAVKQCLCARACMFSICIKLSNQQYTANQTILI